MTPRNVAPKGLRDLCVERQLRALLFDLEHVRKAATHLAVDPDVRQAIDRCLFESWRSVIDAVDLLSETNASGGAEQTAAPRSVPTETSCA